jgi:hypothetical protein
MSNVLQVWAEAHSLAVQHQAATHKVDILVTIIKDILLQVLAVPADILAAIEVQMDVLVL